MSRKYIVTGCLALASFFIGCQSQGTAETESTEEKELEMYEASELANLMREMYEDNLEIRKKIIDGELPESFPEDFYTIHTAKATEPEKLNETFKALANEYIENMEQITAAQNRADAIKAYNGMVSTCASCHQIYCQGPLPKIRKMKIAVNE